MKLIVQIAKNEFRYLFYSPIAWFLLIVFTVESAVFYTGPVYDFANYLDIMLKNNPQFKGSSGSLTNTLFIRMGFFQNIISNLYLFIPLLTMGLISREVNTGSVKLLYSSPLRLRLIVLGKYLGIMLFNLLLVLIVGIFMVMGAFNIAHVDGGILLSAILGFYLLVCTYSAIGLFMSSLSSYQIISALSSFVIIFVLSRIGGLWQRYDFVRDLTYFLSLQNRTWKMLNGLIVTKDVIYFMMVTAMFICFTLIKLRAGREAKPWYVKAGRYALVMIVALAAGYISSRPTLTGYLDATATKSNTIDPRTQKNIKALGDSTLEVTLYTNLLGSGLGHGLPEARNADYMSNFWEPYLRFKPDMVFKYEYYYDTDVKGTDSLIYKQFPGKSLKEIAAESADEIDADLSMFKTPEQMYKTIDLRPEGYRVVMQLKYRGHTEFLRTFDDPFFWPDEVNVNAVLKRLLTRPPRIGYITGDLERSIYKGGEREYSFHAWGRGGLTNIGFDVDTLNLSTQNIPPDITAIVLADPKIDLSPSIQDKLKDYLNRGGNMLLVGKSGKQYVLNPFLRQLGVQLMPGQLVEPTFDETPDKVRPYMTDACSDFYTEPHVSIKEQLERGDTSSRNVLLLMTGATGIEYPIEPGGPFIIKPLLMTSPGRVWLKAGNLIIDSTLPPLNLQEGDIKKTSFVTAVQLTREFNGKQQRIVICSDADFLSNLRQGYLFLGRAFYSWFDYNKNPVYLSPHIPRDVLLNISADSASVQKTVMIWILPGAILLLATLLLIRRKRK
jgi:gliding motility-associated transport system permease protein/gliding motility-associatede transport system auxiliary component